MGFFSNFSILALSFTQKSLMRIHLKPKVEYSKFVEAQQKTWQLVVDDGKSFVIRDKAGRMVGVCFNNFFDFALERKPHIDIFSDFDEFYRHGFVQVA